ncbi:hypothetical protein [Bacillus sp. KH172YL63]|uniref:hypothetical protein n=1 Tax=Bacillus sp. KH172YL63 TaxID=2709784 RepID=UPI0015642D48|nr:hypothetical protein [Bacillus sp. KH172YL63]
MKGDIIQSLKTSISICSASLMLALFSVTGMAFFTKQTISVFDFFMAHADTNGFFIRVSSSMWYVFAATVSILFVIHYVFTLKGKRRFR